MSSQEAEQRRILKVIERVGGFERATQILNSVPCIVSRWVVKPEFGVSPTFIELDMMARQAGVRFKWLVSGIGPMLKKKARKAQSE